EEATTVVGLSSPSDTPTTIRDAQVCARWLWCNSPNGDDGYVQTFYVHDVASLGMAEQWRVYGHSSIPVRLLPKPACLVPLNDLHTTLSDRETRMLERSLTRT